MPFPHERLAFYQKSVAFLTFANDLVEHLPRGRSHIADQLTRASTSIVLNIAEGAGKLSRPDKRRYYLTSLGSVMECAAILDVCLRLKLITERRCEEGKGMLEEVGKMLTAVAKGMEGKGKDRDGE
jgi:four helix bundle protein